MATLPNMDEYGCVESKRNRETGTQVSIYHSDSAGMDSRGGLKFHAVCEDHGTMMGAKNITEARHMVYDTGSWCGECSDKLYAPGGKRNPNLGGQF